MLEREYVEVAKVRSPAEFLDQIVRFAHRQEFDLVGATIVVDRPGADSDFHGVDNMPAGFRKTFENPINWKRDPVSQHCKHHSVPSVWNQATYTSSGLGDLWEEQAVFGLKTGIALGVHLPSGRHLFIGIDRAQPLPKDPALLSRLVADLQLFAICATEAGIAAMAPASEAAVVLAPREIECLSWTMEGKTAWEVGAIVGVAEPTVVSYLRNAMRKLGCVSKHQAVVRALRLGLLR